MSGRGELEAVLAEVRQLRRELSAMTDVISLFYEAGWADALHVRPRIPAPRLRAPRKRGNLALVRTEPRKGS